MDETDYRMDKEGFPVNIPGNLVPMYKRYFANRMKPGMRFPDKNDDEETKLNIRRENFDFFISELKKLHKTGPRKID